jgi:hypothetical protein
MTIDEAASTDVTWDWGYASYTDPPIIIYIGNSPTIHNFEALVSYNLLYVWYCGPDYSDSTGRLRNRN